MTTAERLAEAEAAYHALMTGQAVVEVTDQSGERVRFTTAKRQNIPNWYEGLNAEAYSACEWIGAGQGLIDPLKETQAHVLQLNNGLTTRERVMARLNGADWRNDFRQLARENAEAATHGLVFSGSQDMNNALSGSPRSGDGAATSADDSTTEDDAND